ncbi:hypothetical protein BLNAU_4012 [Blattamonas nauphoetae]|uniref:Ubiquitin-like domain-containing protein n=1 Tax=Blattamonas nauphoetae TaxID=2049346 RepID=A0ABQ9YAY4_9EUKA|nr:hypothetical protein BLNAU_4012 [Blattamonas nauphoetae]
MSLIIRIPNSKPLIISSSVNNSVHTLMQAIEMKTGISPSKQRLLHGSKRLAPGNLLCDHSIRDLSTIDMSFALLGGWTLWFRIKNQPRLPIVVTDSTTLGETKNLIATQYNIQVEHIATILFHGVPLRDDSKKMEDLGLQNEEVTIILRLPHPPPFSEEEPAPK